MSEELTEVDFGRLSPEAMKKSGFRLLPGRRWRITINKDWLRGHDGPKGWAWRGEGTLEQADERHEIRDYRSEGQRIVWSEKYVCGDYVRSVYIQTFGAAWVK